MSIKINGGTHNKNGIGSIIEVFTKDIKQTYQHFLNRGFQSSMSPKVNIGLGTNSKIDSLKINWYNGKTQTLNNIAANQLITLDIKDAVKQLTKPKTSTKIISKYPNNLFPDYTHKENEYDDFKKEILLPQKQSKYGPQSAIGDVNNDGLEDIFITGAKGFTASLYIQKEDNTFWATNQTAFYEDKAFEDTGCLFVDIDNDNDLDLYVVSGGNEFKEGSKMLQDRIYVNDGKGNFKKALNRLPQMFTSGYAVTSGDFDKDGDWDIFVGGRIIPGKYPLPPQSYLLENTNGFFRDITAQKSPDLQELGLVTDAVFSDYDMDSDLDLIIVGKWMAPMVFINNENRFTPQQLSKYATKGWWYSIACKDVNNDGLPDYFIGNLGENNKFKGNDDKELHLYASDFDNSGSIDIVLASESDNRLLPVRGKECSSEQMPFINTKFQDFTSFAEADLNAIYTPEKIESALHLTAKDFKSVLLLNKGNGDFSKSELPNVVQYGPTLASILEDVNNDGLIDIVGAGNIYETEPETVRYDASKGYILINDDNGKFFETQNQDFLLEGNIKDIQLIKVGEQKIILALQNSGSIQSFKVK